MLTENRFDEEMLGCVERSFAADVKKPDHNNIEP
jgi:hypothetical protein